MVCFWLVGNIWWRSENVTFSFRHVCTTFWLKPWGGHDRQTVLGKLWQEVLQCGVRWWMMKQNLPKKPQPTAWCCNMCRVLTDCLFDNRRPLLALQPSVLQVHWTGESSIRWHLNQYISKYTWQQSPQLWQEQFSLIWQHSHLYRRASELVLHLLNAAAHSECLNIKTNRKQLHDQSPMSQPMKKQENTLQLKYRMWANVLSCLPTLMSCCSNNL